MSDDWKTKLAGLRKEVQPQEPVRHPPPSHVAPPSVRQTAAQTVPIVPPHRDKAPSRDDFVDPAKSQQEAELAALLGEGEKAAKRARQLEAELNALKQELANEKSSREKAETELLQIREAELAPLLGEKEKATDRARQLEAEVNELKLELATEKSLRDRSETDYLNLLQGNEELTEQVEKLNATVAGIATREQSVVAKENALLRTESRSKAEADRLATLAETIGPREELDKENRSLRTLNTRLTNKNAELVGTNEEQSEQIGRHRADKKQLREQLRAATDDLDRVAGENKGLRSKVTRVQRELEAALQTTNSELVIRSFETVRWLVESGVENHGLGFPRKICTHGSGPWDTDEFDGLLQELGFQLFNCSDHEETSDIGILVVGTDDWDGDAIEAQINNRDGRSVKVFPQELFIAALACGSDPFDLITDDDDPEIPEFLENFGRDHPVIGYLRSLEFPWPSSNSADAGPKLSPEWEGVEESPLYVAGYTVAENEGLLPSERRSVLSEAFSGELTWVYSDDYMNSWGTPSTRKRLRRIAYHIAMLTRRHGHHTKAIARWRSDLAWLREKHYRPMMRFQWPLSR